jgi:predicted membrane GTPase involved in stress response
MADGALLLIDAKEGPMPQTRFVLRKALEAHLPIILVVNKVDRPDRRIAEVIDEVYELFLELDADEEQFDFPIVYCDARAGQASLDPDVRGEDLRPLLDVLLTRIPAPIYELNHRLQALVTNLDSSPYVGRLALCRVVQGRIRSGQAVAWCRRDGSIELGKIAALYVTEVLEDGEGPVVAVSDFIKAVPDQVARWVREPFVSLGTDGFGRSDTRSDLRRFFEIDAAHITAAALHALALAGDVKHEQVKDALEAAGADHTESLRSIPPSG